MSDFRPTWLYLKQHNVTKLKYFGKTVKEPDTYPGSGVRWTRHLKKHGNDVTTVWKQLFCNKQELMEFATQFSIENNIVVSPEFANLMIENGLVGGDTGITEAGRQKLKSRVFSHTESTKKKLQELRSVQDCPRLGKRHSNETKELLREKRKLQLINGMTGRSQSEAARQKISESKKGKSVNKGIAKTAEHREKLSLAAKARHAKKELVS